MSAEQLTFNVSKKIATTVVKHNKDGVPPSTEESTIEKLVEKYYISEPYKNPLEHELEVKFGTTVKKAPLRRSDYDNVIKKLFALGFNCYDVEGQYSLRIGTTMPNDAKKISGIRVEIDTFDEIQKYCQENNLNAVSNRVKFIHKKSAERSVENREFNFRVKYSTETTASVRARESIKNDWSNSMKTFRFINRVTFEHPNYPFKVDVSIVKSSRNITREYAGGEFKDPEFFKDTTSSGVFTAVEKYEIEIEVDNLRIGPDTEFETPEQLVTALKKVIKFVLSGIQKTNYPIKFSEQQNVRMEYRYLFPKEENEKYKFVGPNPVTLQLENVQETITEQIPNIRNNYVVTDKADGERSFLFVSKREKGKIYLISNDVDVRFTGVKTSNERLFQTLLDGELVTQSKEHTSLNIYLGFDLYCYNGQDTRNLPLIKPRGEKEVESRYNLLNKFLSTVNLESVIKGAKSLPIVLRPKQYFPIYPEVGDKIFEACDSFLSGNYDAEYETDGLIFTPAYLCVYGTYKEKCEKVPNNSMPWRSTFKWKPPEFNTVDFFVETLKGPDGADEIINTFSNGMNMERVEQGSSFKMIELKVSSKTNINPCQAILRDEYQDSNNNNSSYPLTFVPSDPSDINAGRCKIELVDDQMRCKDGDIFKDLMIVEFSYNMAESKWEPLRVRHDKTNTMLRTTYNRKYGNSYEVAESNWRSIHYPVTAKMLRGKEPIGVKSIDVYYSNTDRNKKKTPLRMFHNYYKSRLINSVSKQSHGRVKTLIDYACGQGGDVYKWSSSNIKFVLGIDLFEDNISRRYDGACARYVNYVNEERKVEKGSGKTIMKAIFLQGNSSRNIKNGDAFGDNVTSHGIVRTLFNEPQVSEEQAKSFGKGVYNNWGVVKDGGFDISSCQFALHYFFENVSTLKAFITNLVECTKLNGYFIGTAYDGKKVFQYLKKNKGLLEYRDEKDESLTLSINRDYDENDKDDFMTKDDSSSLGKQISVFTESIGQHFAEYLINFDYFKAVMSKFGFEVLTSREANEIGLPFGVGGLGSFEELLRQYKDKKSKNQLEEFAKDMYTVEMSKTEQRISSLSMYFVFKKVRDVRNPEKIEINDEPEEVFMEQEEFNELVVENPKITKLLGEQIELTEDKEDVNLKVKVSKKRGTPSTTKPPKGEKKTKTNK